MEKKIYKAPLVEIQASELLNIVCKSLEEGEGPGPGVAEGKDRNNEGEDDSTWGNLW